MTAFLLDWAIRSTILLALGLAGYALLRRRSAAATHTVLAVTLIGAALLPAIRPLVPAWRMPLGFAARELPPHAAQAPVDLKPYRATAPLLPALESVPDLPTQQVAPVVPPARPFPWIPTLAIGVPLLLVMRRVLALLWMFSQARRGRSSQKLDEAVGAGCARLNLRRPARARLFDQVACPTAMTWGHFRPIVAMPLPSENWPEGRLAGVVLHELAHVKRGDWLVQQAAGLATAALWFHPLAWPAYRRLRSAAECAADELVLQTGVEPAAYAQYLLESVRARPLRRSTFAFAGVDTMTDSHFETRIKSIISFGNRRRGSARASVLIVAGLAIAGSLAVATASASGGGAAPTAWAAGGLWSVGAAPPAGGSQTQDQKKLEARKRELAKAMELRIEARRRQLVSALKKGRNLTAKQRKALVDLMESQRAELKKLRAEGALLKATKARQAFRFSDSSGARKQALDDVLKAERLARSAEIAQAMAAAKQGLAEAEREIQRSTKEQVEQKRALEDALNSVQSIDPAALDEMLRDAAKQAAGGQGGQAAQRNQAEAAVLRAQLQQLESQKAQLRAQMELMVSELTQLMEKIYGNKKPQTARDKALSNKIRDILQHLRQQPPQTIITPPTGMGYSGDTANDVSKAMEDAERNKAKAQGGTEK